MKSKINQYRNSLYLGFVMSILFFHLISCGVSDDDNDTNPDPGTTEGMVITLAGTGEAGIVNGSGTSASFNRPIDLAINDNGNLFVVDQGNDRIRKVTPDGTTSSFTGSTKGFNDGNGSEAQFNAPISIAIDNNGDFLLVDIDNYRIRRITSSGTVTTFMGSTPGIENGHFTEATLGISTAIAVGHNGNIYFSDYGEKDDDLGIIRRVSSGEVISWVGGPIGYADGAGENARFFAPSSIVVDGVSNLYIADTKNHLIRKVSNTGVVTTYAGSTQGIADGPANAAKFNEPSGLAIDDKGNLYVADAVNHKIRKIDTSGEVTTLAGSTQGFADGDPLEAQFNLPTAIEIDDKGNLYVTDLGNHSIRKIIVN